MTESQIVVHNLSKTYRVPEREPGLAASLKSLVRRTYRDVEAVRDVSFTVGAGEMIGFIGPNGAGKTTMLKMLSGLLYPTVGEARRVCWGSCRGNARPTICGASAWCWATKAR
jgi:ABC-2 type transport system ATP-binding protein